MGALADIIAEGITKFGGEIVAGILLMIALWMFPGLKRLFGRESASEREQRIQRELEVHRQQEEKLREELRRKDEALQQVKSQKADEAIRRTEIKQVKNKYNKVRIAVVIVIAVVGLWVMPIAVAAVLMVMTAVVGLWWWSPLSDNPVYPKGQNALGDKYYFAKNYEQALEWYRKAAEQGLAEAQCNLGVMYKYGKGVAKDINEARKWYQLAAAQDLELAKQALESLKQGI